VAERVREREWHESQEMHELPGGVLELRLRLGALLEVEQWVLGWGAAAEVVAPVELRAQLRATTSALVALYQDPAKATMSAEIARLDRS
jgi:proteasome accessory factor B